MTGRTLRIGELAKRTGVSVRTLHHYDDLGLLRPGLRTDAGHRLYRESDVARLTTIRALQATGFSLDEIRSFLGSPRASVGQALQIVVDRAREALAEQTRLCRRLERVTRLLGNDAEASFDDLITAIEEITVFEKYYTREQLKQLEERAELIGQERIREVQREWQDLFAAFRDARARGLAADHPDVKALQDKRAALIEEFTGGDADILASLGRMWSGEPSVRERYGVEPGLMDSMDGPSPSDSAPDVTPE